MAPGNKEHSDGGKDRTATTHSDASGDTSQTSDHNIDAHGAVEPMLFCPVRSTRLASVKCKLICHCCGYHMSCADYY